MPPLPARSTGTSVLAFWNQPSNPGRPRASIDLPGHRARTLTREDSGAVRSMKGDTVQEVALFVDLENITMALWNNFQQSPDVFKWVDKVRKYGPMGFARAYGDFSQPHLSRLEPDLRALGIEKFDCPTKQRGDGSQSTVDSNIIIDLYEVALDRPGIKTFMLMAGDIDYMRVVARLRHRLDKTVVIAGVPGSISGQLVRAAGNDDPIEPLAVDETDFDERQLIRLINTSESTLPENMKPTFRALLKYVSDPRNASVVSPQTAQATLTRLVNVKILQQQLIELPDGRQLTTTALNRAHPSVQDALNN